MSAISFLAGLGAGYSDGRDRAAERARRDAKDRAEAQRLAVRDAKDRAEAQRLAVRDARDAENHEYLQAERAVAAADRDALRAASAPLEVQTEQLPGPTLPDAPPLPTTYKVGGRHFAQRGIAQAEADRDNTPESTRARISRVLAQQDPVKADQFRSSGLQADAAELQVKQAAVKAMKEGTLDATTIAINGGSSEQVMAAFNRFGELKVTELKVEPFEFDHPTLGRQKSARLVGKMSDGTPLKVDNAFELGMGLFGAAKKYELLGDWAAKKQANDNQAARLKIDQQNADTQAGYRRDQAAHNRAMQGIAATKAAAGAGPAQVTLKDKREFESDLSDHIKDLYPVKEGMDQAERAAISAQATAKKALGNTLFQNNAQIGIPLTAATVLQAMELAGDRKNVKTVRVGGVPHEGVVVNGQVVVTSGPLQERAAAPATASPGATPLPGQAVINPDIRNAPPGSWRAPGAAAKAAAGVSTAAPSAPRGGDQALQRVMDGVKSDVAQLHESVLSAKAQLAAVARSGDPVALRRYSAALQQAITERDTAARKRLGNAAPAFLATLPQ